ncbi:replication factor C small subunit [Methanocaldococcus bathoardescens]|uniref:Replication factor C small subunit n=1 Tax=Methanocaldococcus bathoardescens TaxID=1301915 RepID=A0A076LFY8_9EURY|nr:replication factor C small subunit [Methanocaldococcus bathoardescens]AIJ05393.1 replication factor C small subunit [Methanocaldococcus bathoardescens]
MDKPWVEKYRPKTLDDIVGQDEIVKRLKKYVEKKSMPHLLFSGPPGVGKCLTGDTKVIINGEIREIGEVVEEISNGKFGATLVNNIKVLGIDEYGKIREFDVQYVYKDKTNTLIKIKTKMGRELKVTTYHPLLINNKNGEIKWEKAENLKVGDKLAVPCNIVYKKDSFIFKDEKLKGNGLIVNENILNYLSEKLNLDVDLSKNVLKEILHKLELISHNIDDKLRDAISYILFLHENELYWDKIVEIEQLDGDFIIYDLHVPKYHNFIGGNLPTVLHNTTAALCLARDLFGENWRDNFLELNASDERGIDVIRTKVKDFARTKPIGDVPFKIIFLDESDALTADAQNALRRTMEKYSDVCRFILSCNYPSKIIPPIQSRCAVFRFSPLKKEDIAKKLKEIAEKEGLNLTESGLEAIIYVSEGDMRKAINVLQTAAALSNVIDDEIVYKVSSRARPEEVKKMMELALDGKFIEARDLLYKLMVEWGMSGEDILNQMFREINSLDIDERKKVELADAIGETDFRIVEGANERIQLSALLAKMALMGR